MAYANYRIIAPEFVEETSTLFGSGQGGVAEILPSGELGPTVPIDFGPYAGYRVSSATVYDPTTGRAAAFYDPIRENIMQVYNGTSANFQLGSQFDRINSGRSLENEYGIAGTVRLTLADESTIESSVLVPRVARAGYRVVASDREGGGTNFNQYPMTTALADIQRELGPTARFASSDETARHALLGWLMGELKYGDIERQRQLQDVIDAVRSQPGNESLDNYEAIQVFLDQATFADLTAVTRTGVRRE